LLIIFTPLKLTLFIAELLTTGQITVDQQDDTQAENEQDTVIHLLQQYYLQDSLEMPYTAPEFDKEAAYWAAEYLYQAIILTVNRDADPDAIKEKLKPYPGTMHAGAIYSADLLLRNLPRLLHLVKGLAPADILVQELNTTAAAWPFSSVGIELNNVTNEALIFSHPSLRTAYVDRIIAAKDRKRADNPMVIEQIKATAGEYMNRIWPEAELIN
jgi:MoxR-vWA-beta-propeller ternary system domain bpX4